MLMMMNKSLQTQKTKTQIDLKPKDHTLTKKEDTEISVKNYTGKLLKIIKQI